jgi:hypothetical protein
MGQRIGLSFNDIKAANFHYCQSKSNVKQHVFHENVSIIIILDIIDIFTPEIYSRNAYIKLY